MICSREIPMKKVDREALQRALRMAKAENKQQIKAKLKTEPWIEVALFAAYSLQIDNLNLKPWQSPPMHMGDDKPRDESPLAGRVAAWALRRKLLAAGLSVFEPDPVRALETVAARQRGDAPPSENQIATAVRSQSHLSE
jgi:hypothetical protein